MIQKGSATFDYPRQAAFAICRLPLFMLFPSAIYTSFAISIRVIPIASPIIQQTREKLYMS